MSPTAPSVDHHDIELPTPGESLDPLRSALRDAGFTADGCLDALGAAAYAALSRNERVPALRATRGDEPVHVLIRLFLLQAEVSEAEAGSALPLRACLDDGWLTHTPGGAVRATVDVRPYGDDEADWWIVSDLGCAVGGSGGPLGRRTVDDAELVLGMGGASNTLSGITVRRAVREALDLGTGSGVQALHASQHASQVTATDVSPRALRFARLTSELSGVRHVHPLSGSMFEPVGERRYDLIVSNPPFVISPAARFTYRDGGLPGDELCRQLVANAPYHLRPGGYCQLLANWQHVEGEDWRERLENWIAPTGCDAWVVQREVQDPAQYAELWLRDGGDHRGGVAHYEERYAAWLDAFERDGVEGVGFGWITLRRGEEPHEGQRPVVRIEEWPHPVEQPLGPEIEQWFARQDFLRVRDDAALLRSRFQLAEGVLQEEVGAPGSEDPATVVLRQSRGMRRATTVGTVGAGFAGACDGTLTAGEILDAIARLVEEDATVLRENTPDNIRLLVEQGFLEPVGDGDPESDARRVAAGFSPV